MKINLVILVVFSMFLVSCGDVKNDNNKNDGEKINIELSTPDITFPGFGNDLTNEYFKIGGSISGLNGPVTLVNNQEDELVIEENGEFEFSNSLIDGSDFLVEQIVNDSETPERQYCIILYGSGTIFGSDMMNIMVICISHDISRVSISDDEEEGEGRSYSSSISGDGRYVAFSSTSDNLVMDDENGYADVFMRDTLNEETMLVSINSNSNSSDPLISGDGRFIAFRSGYIYLYDSYTGDTDIVTFSQSFSMSNNGRYIAFESNNNVYVYDTQTNQSKRVSVTSDGFAVQGRSYSPSISGDGRYVAFSSTSDNLVLDDENGYADVFMRDTETGQTTLISVDSDGMQANEDSLQKSISADGRFVVFNSAADNLVLGDLNEVSDIFLHNTQTGETSRISISENGQESNGESSSPSISNDGRYVTFSSTASNLISTDKNGVSDVFVYDTQTGKISRLSKAKDFTEGLYESHSPSISGDGRYVTFSSVSSFVNDDTNNSEDVYKVVNPL